MRVCGVVAKKCALTLLASGFRFQTIMPSMKCMCMAIAPGPGFTTCARVIAVSHRTRIVVNNRTGLPAFMGRISSTWRVVSVITVITICTIAVGIPTLRMASSVCFHRISSICPSPITVQKTALSSRSMRKCMIPAEARVTTTVLTIRGYCPIG